MKILLLTLSLILLLSSSFNNAYAAKLYKLCLKEDGVSVVSRKKCKKSWTQLNLSALKGNKGDTGATGATGAAGASGASGSEGPAGMDAAWGDASAGSKTWQISGTYSEDNPQFGDVTIEAGVTLNVASGSIIRCAGSFENYGTISVTTTSNSGIRDSDWASDRVLRPHPGITVWDAPFGESGTNATDLTGGIPGFTAPGIFNPPGNFLRTITRPPLYAGSPGGVAYNTSIAGGGGGSIGIYCEGPILNNGTIQALGSDALEGDGGGGGGIIILASGTSVTNTGSLDVSGGDGGGPDNDEGAGGGGGGGLIHILAPTITTGGGTSTIAAGSGGNAGTTTASPRAAGGAGGSCAGKGGDGGDVLSNNTAQAGSSGEAGLVIERIVDNPAGLL